VYGEEDGDIESEETFEYYYNKLIESPNTKFIDLKLVDSHDHLEEVDFDKIVDNLGEDLSEQEKKEIAKTIDKHREKSSSFGRGDRAMAEWETMTVPTTIKKKRAWFELIKRWATHKGQTDADADQWVRKNRRLAFLESDTGSQLMLPSENEDCAYDDDKVEMWLYLDVSGSCYNLRNDFFCASLTIPHDRIKMRTFCFDTKITEVNLKDRQLISGGGTSFSIIEQHIQKELKPGKKHPVIFVFTDGYGDSVHINEPKKWHWFIEGSWGIEQAKYLSDKKCNFYPMEDFK
jgi:predicted metal-dependent peptidase